MNRILNWIAWIAVAVVAGLAVYNWSALAMPATLDFVFTQVQVPLGATLLGVTAALAALFLVALLQSHIASLMETRQLLKEVKRVQDLADKAEASRIESLQAHVSREFRSLNERLDAMAVGGGGRPESAEVVALNDREPPLGAQPDDDRRSA